MSVQGPEHFIQRQHGLQNYSHLKLGDPRCGFLTGATRDSLECTVASLLRLPGRRTSYASKTCAFVVPVLSRLWHDRSFYHDAFNPRIPLGAQDYVRVPARTHDPPFPLVKFSPYLA